MAALSKLHRSSVAQRAKWAKIIGPTGIVGPSIGYRKWGRYKYRVIRPIGRYKAHRGPPYKGAKILSFLLCGTNAFQFFSGDVAACVASHYVHK